MEYTIKAHPTMFDGVQYRSRLEARWAAFFKLCGWKAVYEPFDLEGWSPDFAIGDVLVEVKPIAGTAAAGADREIQRKIDRAYPEGNALIVWSFPDCMYWGATIGSCRAEEDSQSRLWTIAEDYWKKAGNLVQWKGPR